MDEDKSESEAMTAPELRRLCDTIVADPNLAPSADATFCNLAVIHLMEEIGINSLRGMTANRINGWLVNNWTAVSGTRANAMANNGIPCIAASPGKPHGHVAIVYPGAMMWSGKWAKECPVLANVGSKNAIMGANWCFVDEPSYYTGVR